MQLCHALSLIAGLGVFTAMPAWPQATASSPISERYRWNLGGIFSSEGECQRAAQALRARIPAIEKYQGSLGKSKVQLLDCLQLATSLNDDFLRLFTYANLKFDLDARDQRALALKQEVEQLGVLLSEKTAFIQSETLTLPSAKLLSYLKQDARFGPYAMQLQETIRSKAHIGTPAGEKVLALSGLLSDATASIHDIFLNSEFPYPEVDLGSGKSVKLTPDAFSSQLESACRDDRQKASKAYLGAFQAFRRTFGAHYNAQIQKDIFSAKAKGYRSSLEMALDNDNVPPAIYRNLIQQVHEHLPTLHRYLKLKRRLLGLEQLHYYDLHAPIQAQASFRYTPEDAERLISSALKPLGAAYLEVVHTAMRDGWIDLYPAPGKSQGGYANGYAYHGHPYILFNFSGRYEDVSGLAHELGHAVQSVLSNRRQPLDTAFCPRLITEVASTLNEALLIEFMLGQEPRDEARLVLLNQYLENIKTTVFRAAQIAEFELKAHEQAEKGESITGDRLSQWYLEIARQYYGHDSGVCVVDEEVQSEWTHIPQLYHPFYAYEYAVSYAASTALSERVLKQDAATLGKYLEYLSLGGSDYATKMMLGTGVDLASPEPFELTMVKMNRLMDEMERILDKASKSGA